MVRAAERSMRAYLSFPRGTRIPPPRILVRASDDPARTPRELALARALCSEFVSGCVVLASGSPKVAEAPPGGRIEVVKVPSLASVPADRPLARERLRRLRLKLLSTLFDVFLPDLVVLDTSTPEAEPEAHLLSQRGRLFGSAVLLGIDHDEAEGPCGPEVSPFALCDACRQRILGAARAALAGRRA